jgi:hypothetical protein
MIATPMSYVSCHNSLYRRPGPRLGANKSENQTCRTSRVGKRFHFPVISKSSSVKYHGFNLFLQSSFGDKRAYFLGHSDICVCQALSFQTLLYRRSGCERFARRIVNHLCINVPAGKMHRETGTFSRAGNTFADSFVPCSKGINLSHFIIADSG